VTLRGTDVKRPVVVKIGGGVIAVPGALETTCASVARLGRSRPVIVVPGGGPFADGVRDFQQRVGTSDDAAHWMAMMAMDQFAQVLAERIDGAVLVEEPGNLGAVLGRGKLAVLAVYRWMRAADVLPHSWSVSSDSIAAFVAAAVDAEYLVLVKPVSGEPSDLLDACFATVVPAGLPWTVAAWNELEQVMQKLR
jgi:5-(aminomethyl)-3-furanmethanol phosphate kinase